MTHDELANNLALHLLNDDRMVWEDLPAGRQGSIRPDVYTLQKSFSSPNPISYEVKVSVSDFRSDITKAKWKGYLDFSYGVVFAVPKGLIKKSDVPEGCGLMQFNGQSWHTVKRPTLHPKPLDDDMLLKLIIDGARRETKRPPIKNRDFDEHMHHEKLRKKFGQDYAIKLKFLDEYPEKKAELLALKQELGDLCGVNVDKWCFAQDVAYHLEQFKAMADEDARKALIAKELAKMHSELTGQFNRVIGRYASPGSPPLDKLQGSEQS